MYHLGYYEHYLRLRQQYPNFHFDYPRDWTLKEYGTLWIFDTIKSNRAKKVLEVGCGYDTFFAKEMKNIGVDYWYIDKSNNYLGIGKDEKRFYNTVEERKKYGATFIENPKVRHLIYNNISNNDPIDKVAYVSQFATTLCRSFKPELIKQ